MAYTPQAFLMPLLLLSIALVLTDYYLKPTLHDSGAHLIEYIQQWESPLGEQILDSFSELVMILFVVVPICRYFVVSHTRGLRELTVSMLAFYLSCIIKVLYSEPRPYWEYSDIEAVHCSASWGNPSSHAYVSACLTCYYAYKYNQRTHNLHATLTWTACGVWLGLIGFARSYLGVHFYSQLLLGWVLGVLTTMLFLVWEHNIKATIIATITDRQVVLAWVVQAVVAYSLEAAAAWLRGAPYSELWAANLTSKCGSPRILIQAHRAALIESSAFVLPASFAVGWHIAMKTEGISSVYKISSSYAKVVVVFVVTAAAYWLHNYIIRPETLFFESAEGAFAVSVLYYGVAGVAGSFVGEHVFTHYEKSPLMKPLLHY
jgi:hypothetical protein